MNAQIGISPFKRHLWLLVLAAGIVASTGTYGWLRDLDAQSMQIEIAYRSQAKLDAIRTIFKQHLDASAAIGAFLKGEMRAHAYVEESEAQGFARAMLKTHPDELTAIAIIPPEGSGEAQTISQDGVGRLEPPLDWRRLRGLAPDAPDIQAVQDQEQRWLTQINLAIADAGGTGYVVSDWNTRSMIDIAIAGTPVAGLDIEAGLIKDGQFTRIYHHRSRLRKAAAEEVAWRGSFSLNGIDFEVRTWAVPAVLQRLTPADSIRTLWLGVMLSLLLAYLTYNRSRYGERLRRDVEERSQELSAERQMLRTIMDHAPVGIWSLRKDGQMIFINQAFCAATGVDEQAFLSASHYKDVLDDETARQCIASDEKAMGQDDPVKSVEQVLFADGKRHPMEVLKVRIASSDGEPARLIGIGQDISERLAHEQVLEGERRKLASVIDHANETILLMDDQGAILRANPAACELFGYAAEEWEGLSVHTLVPEEVRVPHVQWMAEEMAGKHHDIMGKVRELRGRRKDGSIFPCEVTVSMFLSGEERRLSVILRDLTAHKQREWSRETLLALRAASQKQTTLHERLQQMLNCMFGDPWALLCEAGAIFLVDGEELRLVASHGWSTVDKDRCASVPFGECLCGKAIEAGEAIFRPHRPEEHRLVDRGEPDTGYLCIPIMNGSERLGLINFKLRPGAAMPDAFRDFCHQVEDIIADMLLRERARESLEASEEKHRTLVEAIPMGIIIHQEGTVRYANPAIAAMLGVGDAGSLLDKNVLDFVAEESRPEAMWRMQQLQQGKPVPPVGERLLRLDGSEFWAEVRGTTVTYAGKSAVQVLVTDINERKQMENVLRESENKFRNLSEQSPNMIFINQGGRIVFANQKCEEVMGYGIDEMSGPDFDFHKLIASECIDMVNAAFATHMQGEDVPSYECTLITKNGARLDTIHSTKLIEYDSKPAILGIITDISGRKEAEEKLQWLSYYDELTKLPNRRLFSDRITQAIALAGREKHALALLFLDLDRFKMINDSLGHACGDEVLKESANRLEQILRASDTAARMGGDEFAVLLPEANAKTAMRVAKKINAALHKPHHLSGQDITLGVSIGIAIFPNDGECPDTLLMHADTAMYHAKKKTLHIHYFSSGMEEQTKKHLRMEQDLAKATDEGQFKLYFQSQHTIQPDGKTSPFPLHYQTKHQLADSAIIGLESLVRWQHPELGVISPAEFIPLAEETGMIRPITHWVLAEAARQANAWEEAGIRPDRIGVNISAVQLMQEGLAEEILFHIGETGAKPEWIEIEITETAAMREPETAIVIMRKLVDAGMSIAIDDFGTGYSSLAYLKRLPAEWLKIDIAFIRDLPDDEENAAIVRSITAMAHALGMKVIAEGVETEAQLEFLRGEDCDAAQGFLFSKPLPADEATSFIKKRPPNVHSPHPPCKPKG